MKQFNKFGDLQALPERISGGGPRPQAKNYISKIKKQNEFKNFNAHLLLKKITGK